MPISSKQSATPNAYPLHLKPDTGILKTIENTEEHMPFYYLLLLGVLLGAALALPLQYIYNTLPESWLQDYDYDPNSPNARPAKRMNFIPHTLFVMISMMLLFFAALYMNKSFVTQKSIFHVLLMLVPLLPFSLIVVSDKLNRIIPDQLAAAVALCSVFGFLADGLEGSFWIAPGSLWYFNFLNRILGAVIGAGLLWGIGIAGSWISGQESMGFGDIKLLFACGLLSGAFGLIFVFFFAFILGGIFAVPLYISKRRRIRAEENVIRASKDPARKRREIEKRNLAVHFAEDPDYIAFGPFLALGTVIFLIFETPLYQFYIQNILASAAMLF